MVNVSSVAKRGISPHEANLLKPVLDRMSDWRVAGRQSTRFTVKTSVDSDSRDAIQRAWNIVADHSPEVRRVVFKHFLLRGLRPEHRNQITEMGAEPTDVVDKLSNADPEQLKEFLKHDAIVHGTKRAADRFFRKGLDRVILSGMQGRKGIFNFGERSARTDIALGLIAAFRDRGLPKG